MVIESNIIPKNKPNISPSIYPWIIDQGNNQNNGQYGCTPKNPSQLGCHKKIIGTKIKQMIGIFFLKSLFIKLLPLKSAPNQLSEVLPKVIFLPFFLLSMAHQWIGQFQ